MEAKTKIFGQHDEATIKQIESCVAAGGGRGVLCADGHKSYAQPVGGGGAHKKKNSPSGGGFCISCGKPAIRTGGKRHGNAPENEKDMGDWGHGSSICLWWK